MKNIKILSNLDTLEIFGGICKCYPEERGRGIQQQSKGAEQCFNICCQRNSWGWEYACNPGVAKTACSEGPEKAKLADYAVSADQNKLF